MLLFYFLNNFLFTFININNKKYSKNIREEISLVSFMLIHMDYKQILLEMVYQNCRWKSLHLVESLSLKILDI